MSRTLEPGLTLLTAAEIRVVVLPIGPMPRDTFDTYVGAFNAHRHVPLHATRCFHQGGPKSPFPHLAYKTGAMHFRFMQADEARRRTRIADLHQQRQVVAVLGLLHCPLVEDLLTAHGEFDRASKQWPEALVARCCAFEPSAAHLSSPGCQKLKDLMVFPAAHLDAHVEVYMTEFAADVLAAIEDMVLNASVTSVKLNTYVDSGDFLGSLAQIEEGLKKLNMNEEEVKEKKRWGRFQKSKGDWALMGGSPRDAFEHYKSAMELSRVAGDAIWYAAAVEGLAHARVLEALIAARPAVSGTVRPSVAAVTAAQQVAASAADQMQGGVTGAQSAPAQDPAPAAAAAGAAAASSFAPSAQAAEPGWPQIATAAAAPGSPKLFTLASTDSAELLQSIIAATKDSQDADASSSTSEQEASTAAEAEAALAEATAEATHVPELLPEADKSDPDSADISATILPPSTDTALAAAAAAAAVTASSSIGNNSSSSNNAAAAAAPMAVAVAAASNSTTNYALSGPAAWSVLARADLEGEVRELLAEARAWYKKKGGALVLQIEQQLKLSRFIAGLHGPVAAQREAADTVGLIIESLPALELQEDRLVSLIEAGQLLGLVGCGRKRLLLLWAALEMYRQAAGDKGPAEAGEMLKLTLKSLEPPEMPRQQDPDDLPHVHWSMKRFLAWQQHHIQHAEDQQQHTSSAAKLGKSSSRNSTAGQAAQTFSNLSKQQQFMQLLGPRLQLLSPEQAAFLEQFTSSSSDGSGTSSLKSGFSSAKLWGVRNSASKSLGFGCDWISPWGSVLVAVLESVVNIPRAGSSPVEAWEAAAALLRESYPLLPQALQVSLLEACAAAGAAMGSRARQRPGPGPGPQVQMKRVLPGPPSLQPLHLSAADVGATGGRTSTASAAAQSGPFIFNPYAAKRQGASAAAAAEAALPEWVCGEEGWVEVLLVNPCAMPLKLDQLQLVVQPLPDDTSEEQQQQRDGTSSRLVQQPDKAAAQSGKQQGQQQQQGVGRGLGISDSVSNVLNPVQAPRSVAVSLPAGSKPVRVLLSYSPPRAGYMAVTGIQLLGVSWYQPFVQLPKLTAAAAGPEALSPQGVFTVSVQPPLPLLKAVLHGPEVQLVAPSEDELAGFTNASCSSSSWSTAAGGAAGGNAAAAGAGAAAAAAGVAELDKKVTNVFVFEGQSLNWTLSLTNISSQPVTGCKVSVLNAKGLLIKPLNPAPSTPAGQQQQLPASFSGAHMEVGEQGLADSLPLNPGCSMTLPVSVTVGKPPGDAFDAIMLQVRVTYYGTANSSEGDVVGRRLMLPVKLSIQPTLQIKNIRFLQQTLPLLNGRRYIKPRLLHISHAKPPTDSRSGGSAAGNTPKQQQGLAGLAAQQVDGGLAALSSPSSSLLRRQKSHHVRNSSDGAVHVLGGMGAVGVSAMLLSRSPTRSSTCKAAAFEGCLGGDEGLADPAAAAAAAMHGVREGRSSSIANFQQQQQSDAASGPSPIKAEIVAAAGSLAVGSEPVLELAVRNASDRYFRAWLGCLPDHITAETSLTVVAVLEPGDTRCLLAVLPAAVAPGVAALSPPRSHSPTKRTATTTAAGTETAAAAAGHAGSSSSSSVASSGLSEPSRLACAEGLVERLVVCWEMITGAAAAGQLPRGKVQLAPVDVAANLTPGTIAAVRPSPLLLRFSVPPHPAAVSGGTELVDLVTHAPPTLASLIASGLPGLSGPLWGLRLSVGQWITVELEITYNPSGSVTAAAAAVAASSTILSSTTSDNSSSSSMPGEHDALQLLVSLSVTDLLSSSSSRSSSTGQHPGTPTSATAAAASAAAMSNGSIAPGSVHTPPVDPGVFIVGCYNGFQVSVQPGGRETVRLQVLLVQSGLYQFSVADVMRVSNSSSCSRAVSGVSGGGGACGSSGGGAGSREGSRLYYNQDRLYVLAQQ